MIDQEFVKRLTEAPIVVLDIETLSTAHDAFITEISSVVYDFDTNESFSFRGIHNFELVTPLGRIDSSTLNWRLKTPTVFSIDVEHIGGSLPEIFSALEDFWTKYTKEWSHVFIRGKDFDLPIIKNSGGGQALSMFTHSNFHCLRDLELFSGIKADEKSTHESLTDCIHSVNHIRKILGENLI